MKDLIYWFNQNNNSSSSGDCSIDENKLYKVKLNDNDKSPSYLQDKIDNETITIYNNKVTSIFKKEVKIPSKIYITIKNNTNKTLLKDELVLIDINDTPLIDLATFTLYDELGNVIDYTFYDNDNQRYVVYKTKLLVIKLPKTLNPNDTLQISADNTSYTIDLKNIYYLYIPKFDNSIQIWDPTKTGITTGFYKRNTPQISNNTLILDANDGIRTVQKFSGDIILEVVGKPHASNNIGSFCRIATADNYGYVRDGGANIVDLLLWNNNNIYYEWNNGETKWIKYPVNTYQKHKITLLTKQNKIIYQVNNNTASHTGGLINDYYIYLYSSSGRLTIRELYAYKPVTTTLDIVDITVTDPKNTVINTRIDLYYEYGRPKVIARLLETGDVLELSNPENIADLIKRPKIIRPRYNETTTYYNKIVASEYTTSSTFNGYHTSSDWEISTNEYFTNLVYNSYNDSENLTELDMPLLENGIYYVRVRYRSNNIVSRWSYPVKFNVKNNINIQEISWDSDRLIAGHTYTLTIIATSLDNLPLTYGLSCTDDNVIIEQTSEPNKFRVTFPNSTKRKYYTFEIKISDGNDTITIERKYEVTPIVIPDVFNDNSCKTLIKFDNNTITDVFGNANISTVGTPKFTNDGVFDSAFYAINKNGILINNFQSLINETSYTVSLWVKLFGPSNDGQILFAGSSHFELAYFNDGYIKVAYASDQWKWQKVAKPEINEYIHIAYVFINLPTKKKVGVYINGELRFDGSFSNTSKPGKFALGYRYDCCGGAYIKKAYFDQLRFFNRVLNSDEIMQLYTMKQ